MSITSPKHILIFLPNVIFLLSFIFGVAANPCTITQENELATALSSCNTINLNDMIEITQDIIFGEDVSFVGTGSSTGFSLEYPQALEFSAAKSFSFQNLKIEISSNSDSLNQVIFDVLEETQLSLDNVEIKFNGNVGSSDISFSSALLFQLRGSSKMNIEGGSTSEVGTIINYRPQNTDPASLIIERANVGKLYVQNADSTQETNVEMNSNVISSSVEMKEVMAAFNGNDFRAILRLKNSEITTRNNYFDGEGTQFEDSISSQFNNTFENVFFALELQQGEHYVEGNAFKNCNYQIYVDSSQININRTEFIKGQVDVTIVNAQAGSLLENNIFREGSVYLDIDNSNLNINGNLFEGGGTQAEIQNSVIQLKENQFENAQTRSIGLQQTSVEMDRNIFRFQGNEKYVSINQAQGSNIITNNCFLGLSGKVFIDTSSGSFDMNDNWWGHRNGPNPDGQGTKLRFSGSGPIDYSPRRTPPSTCVSGFEIHVTNPQSWYGDGDQVNAEVTCDNINIDCSNLKALIGYVEYDDQNNSEFTSVAISPSSSSPFSFSITEQFPFNENYRVEVHSKTLATVSSEFEIDPLKQLSNVEVDPNPAMEGESLTISWQSSGIVGELIVKIEDATDGTIIDESGLLSNVTSHVFPSFELSPGQREKLNPNYRAVVSSQKYPSIVSEEKMSISDPCVISQESQLSTATSLCDVVVLEDLIELSQETIFSSNVTFEGKGNTTGFSIGGSTPIVLEINTHFIFDNMTIEFYSEPPSPWRALLDVSSNAQVKIRQVSLRFLGSSSSKMLIGLSDNSKISVWRGSIFKTGFLLAQEDQDATNSNLELEEVIITDSKVSVEYNDRQSFVKMRNNTFHSGIEFVGVSAVLDENEFTNCGSSNCIYMAESKAVVSNHHLGPMCSKSAACIISLGTSEFELNDNIFEESHRGCFLCMGCLSVNINNNVFRGCKNEECISLSGVSNGVNVNGNTFEGGNAVHLVTNSLPQAELKDNVFRGTEKSVQAGSVGSLVMENNAFYNSGEVKFINSVQVSSTEARNNCFYGPSGKVYLDGGPKSLSNNWWGHPSGPAPEGLGTPLDVHGSLDYSLDPRDSILPFCVPPLSINVTISQEYFELGDQVFFDVDCDSEMIICEDLTAKIGYFEDEKYTDNFNVMDQVSFEGGPLSFDVNEDFHSSREYFVAIDTQEDLTFYSFYQFEIDPIKNISNITSEPSPALVGEPLKASWQSSGIVGNVSVILKNIQDESIVFNSNAISDSNSITFNNILLESTQAFSTFYEIIVQSLEYSNIMSRIDLTIKSSPFNNIIIYTQSLSHGVYTYPGEEIIICWDHMENNPATEIDIEIFNDKNTIHLASNISSNINERNCQKITVPDSPKLKHGYYFVKMTSVEGLPAISNHSYEFDIDEKSLKLMIDTEPNDGNWYQQNNEIKVSWEVLNGYLGSHFDMYLLLNDSSSIIIADKLSGNSTTIELPQIFSMNATLKIQSQEYPFVEGYSLPFEIDEDKSFAFGVISPEQYMFYTDTLVTFNWTYSGYVGSEIFVYLCYQEVYGVDYQEQIPESPFSIHDDNGYWNVDLPNGLYPDNNYAVLLEASENGKYSTVNLTAQSKTFEIQADTSISNVTVVDIEDKEYFLPGDQFQIKWESGPYSGKNVTISIVKEYHHVYTIDSSTSNMENSSNNSCLVTIPNSDELDGHGFQYAIQVRSDRFPESFDYSHIFEIDLVEKELIFNSPNENAFWEIGETKNITWKESGVIGSNNLYLNSINGSSITVDQNISSKSGVYDWTVSLEDNEQTGWYYFTIEATQYSNISDVSNSFEIGNPPSIELISLKGYADREYLTPNDIVDIKWKSMGRIEFVEIDLLLEENILFNIDNVTNKNGENRYEWNVEYTGELIRSNEYQIQISGFHLNKEEVFDTSHMFEVDESIKRIFNIETPLLITTGDNMTVSWNTTGYCGVINIELVNLEKENSSFVIAENLNASGSEFDWIANLFNEKEGNFTIQIESETYPFIIAESEPFYLKQYRSISIGSIVPERGYFIPNDTFEITIFEAIEVEEVDVILTNNDLNHEEILLSTYNNFTANRIMVDIPTEDELSPGEHYITIRGSRHDDIENISNVFEVDTELKAINIEAVESPAYIDYNISVFWTSSGFIDSVIIELVNDSLSIPNTSQEFNNTRLAEYYISNDLMNGEYNITVKSKTFEYIQSSQLILIEEYDDNLISESERSSESYLSNSLSNSDSQSSSSSSNNYSSSQSESYSSIESDSILDSESDMFLSSEIKSDSEQICFSDSQTSSESSVSSEYDSESKANSISEFSEHSDSFTSSSEEISSNENDMSYSSELESSSEILSSSISKSSSGSEYSSNSNSESGSNSSEDSISSISSLEYDPSDQNSVDDSSISSPVDQLSSETQSSSDPSNEPISSSNSQSSFVGISSSSPEDSDVEYSSTSQERRYDSSESYLSSESYSNIDSVDSGSSFDPSSESISTTQSSSGGYSSSSLSLSRSEYSSESKSSFSSSDPEIFTSSSSYQESSSTSDSISKSEEFYVSSSSSAKYNSDDDSESSHYSKSSSSYQQEYSASQDNELQSSFSSVSEPDSSISESDSISSDASPDDQIESGSDLASFSDYESESSPNGSEMKNESEETSQYDSLSNSEIKLSSSSSSSFSVKEDSSSTLNNSNSNSDVGYNSSSEMNSDDSLESQSQSEYEESSHDDLSSSEDVSLSQSNSETKSSSSSSYQHSESGSDFLSDSSSISKENETSSESNSDDFSSSQYESNSESHSDFSSSSLDSLSSDMENLDSSAEESDSLSDIEHRSSSSIQSHNSSESQSEIDGSDNDNISNSSEESESQSELQSSSENNLSSSFSSEFSDSTSDSHSHSMENGSSFESTSTSFSSSQFDSISDTQKEDSSSSSLHSSGIENSSSSATESQFNSQSESNSSSSTQFDDSSEVQSQSENRNLSSNEESSSNEGIKSSSESILGSDSKIESEFESQASSSIANSHVLSESEEESFSHSELDYNSDSTDSSQSSVNSNSKSNEDFESSHDHEDDYISFSSTGDSIISSEEQLSSSSFETNSLSNSIIDDDSDKSFSQSNFHSSISFESEESSEIKRDDRSDSESFLESISQIDSNSINSQELNSKSSDSILQGSSEEQQYSEDSSEQSSVSSRIESDSISDSKEEFGSNSTFDSMSHSETDSSSGSHFRNGSEESSEFKSSSQSESSFTASSQEPESMLSSSSDSLSSEYSEDFIESSYESSSTSITDSSSSSSYSSTGSESISSSSSQSRSTSKSRSESDPKEEFSSESKSTSSSETRSHNEENTSTSSSSSDFNSGSSSDFSSSSDSIQSTSKSSSDSLSLHSASESRTSVDSSSSNSIEDLESDSKLNSLEEISSSISSETSDAENTGSDKVSGRGQSGVNGTQVGSIVGGVLGSVLVTGFIVAVSIVGSVYIYRKLRNRTPRISPSRFNNVQYDSIIP